MSKSQNKICDPQVFSNIAESERSLDSTALPRLISRLPMRCISAQIQNVPLSPALRAPYLRLWKGSWSSVSCLWGAHSAFRPCLRNTSRTGLSTHCGQISALISYMLGTDRLGTAGAVAWSMLPKRQEGTRTWPTITLLSQAMWGVLWLYVVPAQRPGCFACTIESSSISHRDRPSKSKCWHSSLLMSHF